VTPTHGDAKEKTQMTLVALTAGALAALLLTLSHGTPQQQTVADPHYCVVIRDAQGHPINTTCIPWLLG
jgi:hypothetical protein